MFEYIKFFLARWGLFSMVWLKNTDNKGPFIVRTDPQGQKYCRCGCETYVFLLPKGAVAGYYRWKSWIPATKDMEDYL